MLSREYANHHVHVYLQWYTLVLITKQKLFLSCCKVVHYSSCKRGRFRVVRVSVRLLRLAVHLTPAGGFFTTISLERTTGHSALSKFSELW